MTRRFTLRSGYVGNFLALVSGEIVSRGVAFIATAVLAYRLGPDGFGILGFAAALTGYLVTAVTGGLRDLATREIARRPQEAARLASSIVRFRLWLGLVSLLVAFAVAALLPKPPLVRATVALSAVSLLPLALNTSWAYRALERSWLVSASLVLAQLVFAAGVVVLVHGPADLLRVPILQAVGELAAAFLLLPLLIGAWRAGSASEGATAMRGAGTITASRILRTLIVTSDVVILSFLANDYQVGLYSAAYRLCFLLTAVAVSTHVALLPQLARAHDNPVKGSQVLASSLWLSGTIGLPLVLGGVLVAPDLLSFLFGPEFRAGGGALRILLAGTGLLFLHGAFNQVLLVRGRLGLQTKIVGVAAAVNLVLNFLLIPRYGILGAALATLTAEGIILVTQAATVVRWGWRPKLHHLAQSLVSAGAMAGLLVVLPGSMHVLLRIILGGVAYLTTLGLTGGVPSDTRQELGSAGA